MDSVCPKCKKNISHEDFLFEVQCECGARFNPFMGLEGTASPEEEAPAAPAPAEPKLEMELDDFKESTNAFKEIQDFGEQMPIAGNAPPASSSTSSAAPSYESSGLGMPENDAPSSSGPAISASAGGFVFSSAPQLDGYVTESYLLPVSAQATIDSNAQDPLKEAFLLLKKRAESQGANAIASFQWKVAPDGNRVFVSGLPLKVRRK